MKLFFSHMIASALAGRAVKLPLYSVRSRNKYKRPHQGNKEVARRKSQIERGILKVTE